MNRFQGSLPRITAIKQKRKSPDIYESLPRIASKDHSNKKKSRYLWIASKDHIDNLHGLGIRPIGSAIIDERSIQKRKCFCMELCIHPIGSAKNTHACLNECIKNVVDRDLSCTPKVLGDGKASRNILLLPATFILSTWTGWTARSCLAVVIIIIISFSWLFTWRRVIIIIIISFSWLFMWRRVVIVIIIILTLWSC